MTLGEHLVELRRRLILATAAILVAAIGAWFLVDPVLDALREPIERIASANERTAELNYTNITGHFDIRLQITMTLAIVLASPVWLYQVWAFIVPALHRREKRYALGFLAAAVPLFAAGCAAGWFVLPHMVELLTSFAPSEDTSIIDTKAYVDFVLKLVVAIGIGFVMPVFLVLLNFLGALPAVSILRSWRIAVLAIAVFTAIATPAADVLSMFLLMVPMILLYFAAAGVAWLHDRRLAKRADALDAELAGT